MAVFTKLGQKSLKFIVAQLCLTLCDTMDCSPSGSSVDEILQARILEWVAISFFRGVSWPWHWTWVSCIAGRFFTFWATREAQNLYGHMKNSKYPKQSCERKTELEISGALTSDYTTSYSHQNTGNDIKTEIQISGQDRKPRDKPMYLKSPNLWQKRQEYTIVRE